MQQEKVFVARERETDELKSHLDYALDGKGRVCFVAGLAGSGKTALVQHFAQSALAAEPDLVVAAGSCNAQTGIGDPYLPFREALAMLTDETAAEKAAGKVSLENASRLLALMASSVQILFDVAPYLFGLLIPGGKLVGALGKTLAKQTGLWERLDSLSGKTEVDASIVEPIADQSHVFEQYTAFLRELSQKVPLILFLDDLQWADKASLNLLFHLGRHLEDSRILIIGAYRPEDTVLGRGGERHPLEAVVHELTRYFGDVTVDLDAIPEGDNQRFVAELLDVEPNCLGAEFRRALYSLTGGHALFTVELVQAMRDRGDLVRDAEGCWVESPTLDWTALPARVEGVVEERIARLDVQLQELLLVCSV
jgi:predicted ATPase